jgi:hypothetical protein
MGMGSRTISLYHTRLIAIPNRKDSFTTVGQGCPRWCMGAAAPALQKQWATQPLDAHLLNFKLQFSHF